MLAAGGWLGREQASFIDEAAGALADQLRRDIASRLAGLECGAHDSRRHRRRDPEIEDARHDVVGVELVRLMTSASA